MDIQFVVIMNSLKFFNEKGHILVDDILTENDINHRMYI